MFKPNTAKNCSGEHDLHECLTFADCCFSQTAYVSLGLRRSLRVRGIADTDFKVGKPHFSLICPQSHLKQVVSINTSKRLKELCALVFDSVAPHPGLGKLGQFVRTSCFRALNFGHQVLKFRALIKKK